ncbi:unnamed protein product [Knipowitschia caucasica]
MAVPLPMLLAAYDAIIDSDEDMSSCFDDFEDDSLFNLFHLSRPCLMFIADSVRARIGNIRSKYPQFSVDELVMVTLNYYAHGISSTSLLTKLGLTHTQCPAIISLVSETLSGMTDKFVSFPETPEAKATVASTIERLCGIPEVLGIVAVPHFRVRVSPYDKDDYRAFFGPPGYTAVACQIICDSDGNVLCVDQCGVGSLSELDLWESSAKGRQIEAGEYGPYWFIAGKGHRQSKHVLTCLASPSSESEVRFNEAHAKILGLMWTTLSCLTTRFKVLQQLGFAKENCLDPKANIIRACCVLHNIAKKFSVPPLLSGFEPVYPEKPHSGLTEVNNEALTARQELIQRVFSA